MSPNTDFCNYMTSLHTLHRRVTEGGQVMQVIPPIKCKDGFSFSVQASHFHYCYPKKDDGPWDHFEVAYPSSVEPLLFPYAETEATLLPDGAVDDANVDATVLGYSSVPIEIVLAVIARHGGIV